MWLMNWILGFKVYEGELRSKSTQKIFHSILIVNNNVSIIAGETYAGSGKEDFLFIVNKEECRE